MKMSPELNDALNEQIMHEYTNQLIYAQLESIFESLQLKNISKYFREQSSHEKEHADKFKEHINSRTGGKVTIGEINLPPIQDFDLSNIGRIGDIYVSTEEGTTDSIESLYGLAMQEKSYIDIPFLQAMLSEQVEEEDTANEFSLNLKTVKDFVLFDKTFGE